MKRLDQPRIMIILTCLLFTSSCSWLSQRRGLFEGPESAPEQTPAPNAPVSREQYDQLVKQHQELMQRHELLQKEWQSSKQDPQLLTELRLAKESPELAETVDVFSGTTSPQIQTEVSKPASMTSSKPVIDSRALDPAMVEEHIQILRASNTLLAENRYDQALREIRKVENSPIRQIRARAKYNLGEVLFQQGEFDLAMQIFEDVIKTEAFSGIVLKTLGRLIVCSEKLNQEQKRETYFSMFHDFFEQQS